MQYITDMNSYQYEKGAAVTLGKFDGLHRGHQKLVDKIREYESDETRSIVCAFDMGNVSLLTNEERKARLSGQVDCLIVCPFTNELREMEAEDFIHRILIDRLHATHIVVGTDFHFGHGKRGDAEMLEKYAASCGYHLDVIEKEKYGGREISSTFIKEAMAEGNIELVNQLLGYSYHTSGVVEHGKQLGRTLGFPTMNIAPPVGKLMPRFGVYACDVLIDGQRFHGIGNVGIKPTVAKEPKLLVEVFAFGFEGDAYGKKITVEFCSFERPETKFQSVEELKARVDADIIYGKNFFSC